MESAAQLADEGRLDEARHQLRSTMYLVSQCAIHLLACILNSVGPRSLLLAQSYEMCVWPLSRGRRAAAAEGPLLQQLIADLGYVYTGFRDKKTYDRSGRQRSLATAMTHIQQRSNHVTGLLCAREAF
jgi:hypothetical protein